MSSKVNVLIVAIVAIGITALSSCDRQVSLRRANFVWDQSLTDTYNRHVNAYFWEHNDRLIAVLNWRGTGQVAFMDYLVLLCLNDKSPLVPTPYNLQDGIAIETTYLRSITGQKIARLRVLTDNYFSGIRCSNNTISLDYHGVVHGKSHYDTGEDMKYLGFEVKAKNNEIKVKKTIALVYQLLAQEKDAELFMNCLPYPQVK